LSKATKNFMTYPTFTVPQNINIFSPTPNGNCKKISDFLIRWSQKYLIFFSFWFSFYCFLSPLPLWKQTQCKRTKHKGKIVPYILNRQRGKQTQNLPFIKKNLTMIFFHQSRGFPTSTNILTYTKLQTKTATLVLHQRKKRGTYQISS